MESQLPEGSKGDAGVSAKNNINRGGTERLKMMQV